MKSRVTRGRGLIREIFERDVVQKRAKWSVTRPKTEVRDEAGGGKFWSAKGRVSDAIYERALSPNKFRALSPCMPQITKSVLSTTTVAIKRV